jgi:sulfonate transport system substrate-binding protein
MLASNALAGAPYAVEWSEFSAAQPLLEAIGSGAVDLGLVGDAPFMFAFQSGSPIKAVGAQYAPDRPQGALAIVVPHNSPVRDVAGLKGKRVATTRGSVGHYLVIRALAAVKLPADWVQLTFLPPGDAKAAFSSGSIDAWATWTPYLAAAFKDGARSVANGHDFVRGYSFEVANDRAIAGKAALLTDFLAREAKALLWARSNVAAYAAVLARETGLPIDIARDYAEKNGRTAVAIDGRVIADQARVLSDFRTAGAVAGTRDITGAFAPSLTSARVATAH